METVRNVDDAGPEGGIGLSMIDVVQAPDERKDEIWQLFLEYADELSSYDHETRPHTKRHYSYFDSFWQNPNRLAFEVICDHEPIGFCLVEDTGVCYRVNEFYIRPLHRRRGFGRLAVEKVKEHCRCLGRHDVIAANIYVNNAPAVSFWKSAGFKDTGRRIRVKGLRMIETESEL